MPSSTIESERGTGAVTAENDRTALTKLEQQRPVSGTDDMPDEVGHLVRAGKLALEIRRAVRDDLCDDLPAVLELIDEAKLWLPGKGTNQWSSDWADQEGRKRSCRVQDSIEQGTTRMVTVTYHRRSYAVATVTIEPNGNPLVWDRPGDFDDPAVYLSRLVVARKFAGLKIGSGLLNWACDHARRQHKAELVRIDVWTRNFALHKYYRAQGFRWQGYCKDVSYPSRARFQRPADKKIWRAPQIRQDSIPLLTQDLGHED